VNSPSPYGTFDQGGNVAEMTETLFFNVSPGLRGGSFEDDSFGLSSAFSRSRLINTDYLDARYGFRIAASISEPSTGVLAILACCAIWWSRKRFNA
jgi:formylglycine-generating enzyme